MKTATTTLLSPPKKHDPDFGGRPRRINLEQTVAIRGHGKLKVRPIRLDDEQEMIRFHAQLSEESIYLRYFEYLGLDRRTSHERLVQVCINRPESYALVAELLPEGDRPAEIMAVGRLTKTLYPHAAGFETLIADEAHARTIRSILLGRLVTFAHAFGFHILIGDLLAADHDTLNLCRKMGFSLQTLPENSLVRVMIDL